MKSRTGTFFARPALVVTLSAICALGTATAVFADGDDGKASVVPNASKGVATEQRVCSFVASRETAKEAAHGTGAGGETESHKKEKHKEGEHEEKEKSGEKHEHEKGHEKEKSGEKHEHEKEKSGKSKASQKKKDDDHGSEGKVHLSERQLKQTTIRSQRAQAGFVSRELPLTAEISLNANRLSEVGSSVSGRVVDIRAVIGQQVEQDETLALIQSQELAGLVADYLSAKARLRAAKLAYEREKKLRDKRISSEQAFLAAQEALSVAEITLRSASSKLKAIGQSDTDLASYEENVAAAHRYRIEAPIAGTIIRRSLGLGERVDSSKTLFRVADLSNVWVIASVYQGDQATVKTGQSALVRVGAYPERVFEGKITWVSDVLDEETRTLKVRAEVDNSSKLLKPGMFSNVKIVVGKEKVDLVVPSPAVLRHRGENVVFVQTSQGEFVRREISIGKQSQREVQILDGVKAGECVVTVGGFTLKSELDKGEFEGGHAH